MICFKKGGRRTGCAEKMKNSKKGMEMVQVAIMIAIAVALGLIFKDRIMDFVDSTFDGLSKSGF